MNHYRSTIKKYRQRKKDNQGKECPFCSEATIAEAVKETEYSYVVPNLTQYDLWEMHDVTDNLMVIPKRHVTNLKELSEKERLDIINLIAYYESLGYNIYARTETFVKRSVPHQHTHLIKVDNKKPKASIFLRKPYWLFKI